MCAKLLLVFSYYLLVSAVFLGIASVLFLVWVVCRIFFLSVILEVCQCYWSFQRTGSLFYWSLLFFCFEFHWLLIFIISSFLLVSDLFCSFSRFLGWDVILTWEHCFLLSYTSSVINFPPSIAFAVPDWFWDVLFLFSFCAILKKFSLFPGLRDFWWAIHCHVNYSPPLVTCHFYLAVICIKVLSLTLVFRSSVMMCLVTTVIGLHPASWIW